MPGVRHKPQPHPRQGINAARPEHPIQGRSSGTVPDTRPSQTACLGTGEGIITSGKEPGMRQVIVNNIMSLDGYHVLLDARRFDGSNNVLLRYAVQR